MTVTFEESSRSLDLPDGTFLHYNEAGEGQTIVLLHGSGPGATGWANFGPNIGVLAEQFHVIALDLPGWGLSSPRPAAEYDHPEVVAQFCAQLGLDKAAVVGNSMGGMAALALAARHPHVVSHLVTMGTPSGGVTLFDAGGGLTEGLKVLYRGYADPTPESFEETVRIMTYSTPEDVIRPLAVTRAESARSNQEHLDNWLNGSQAGPPLTYGATEQELMSITAPALLIHGRDDRVVPYEHTLRLTRLIPNSRAYLINRCGHWAQLEHADEFNAIVASFVTRAAPGSDPVLQGTGG